MFRSRQQAYQFALLAAVPAGVLIGVNRWWMDFEELMPLLGIACLTLNIVGVLERFINRHEAGAGFQLAIAIALLVGLAVHFTLEHGLDELEFIIRYRLYDWFDDMAIHGVVGLLWRVPIAWLGVWFANRERWCEAGAIWVFTLAEMSVLTVQALFGRHIGVFGGSRFHR